MRFEGQRVTHDGNVVLPSGTAIFRANGVTAAARDVIFGASAEVDVGGVAEEFADRHVLTAGGKVEAISAHGDVSAASRYSAAAERASIRPQAGTRRSRQNRRIQWPGEHRSRRCRRSRK